MNLPAANANKHFPNRPLADPSGSNHYRAEARGKVVVAIFSAPNWSNGSTQKRWSALLASTDSRSLNRALFYVIEDMPKAGLVEGLARSGLKKSYKKGVRPVPLLDETGSVFKELGVPDQTEILVFDQNGTLVDVETNLYDVSETVQRLRAITKLLEDR